MRPHINDSALTGALTAALGLACPGAQARRLLSKTGNVTLFSDASCADPVYANSFILGADVCGKDDAATPYLGAFASLVVNERPWCENGSRPYFNLYRDAACGELVASLPPGGVMYGYGSGDGEEGEGGGDGDGACVAPGEYRGMAFLCDGVAVEESGGWGEGEGGDDDNEEEGGEEDTGMITATATSTSTSTAGGLETTQSTPNSTNESPTTETASPTTTVASSSSISSSTSTTAIPTGGASPTNAMQSEQLLILIYTIMMAVIM